MLAAYTLFCAMLCVSPIILGLLADRFAPQSSLQRHHQRAVHSGYRTVLLGTVVLLGVSLVCSYFANRSSWAQTRIYYCFYIYGSNTVILASVRFLASKLDHDPNDVVRFGLLFQVQAWCTIFNSVSALLMNLFTFYHPGLETLAWGSVQADAYLNSLTAVGSEGFFFFWASSVAAQAIRLLADIVIGFVHTGGTFSSALRHYFESLTPSHLYGCKEPFALTVLSSMYFLCFGWINPHILWLAAANSLFAYIMHILRLRLFNPTYNGTPSVVPFLMMDTYMIMSPMVALIMLAVLWPLGGRFRYVPITGLMMSFSMCVSIYLARRAVIVRKAHHIELEVATVPLHSAPTFRRVFTRDREVLPAQRYTNDTSPPVELASATPHGSGELELPDLEQHASEHVANRKRSIVRNVSQTLTA